MNFPRLSTVLFITLFSTQVNGFEGDDHFRFTVYRLNQDNINATDLLFDDRWRIFEERWQYLYSPFLDCSKKGDLMNKNNSREYFLQNYRI